MNQPGRDSPSRPDTSVREMTSLTVQSGSGPVEPDELEVDDLALDVQERDRVAERRPDGSPRCAVIGQALAARGRSTASRMTRSLPKRAGLGRGDVEAVRGEGGLEVARTGQRASPCPWRHPSARWPAHPSPRRAHCGRRAAPCRRAARPDPGGRAAPSRSASGRSISSSSCRRTGGRRRCCEGSGRSETIARVLPSGDRTGSRIHDCHV